VWFRAAIGRRKNAEARWLLPMICRRGGIDKQDIGAIRIMDTTTEFEISGRAAEAFAVKVKRPDKEDNIRIELLTAAPQGQPDHAKREHAPRQQASEADYGARQNDRSRHEGKPKPHGKPHSESGPRFGKEPGFEQKPGFAKKKKSWDKPAHAGPSQPVGAVAAKPKFGKKAKKNRHG
jgi:ATP-dependent RNA helicase DeaD